MVAKTPIASKPEAWIVINNQTDKSKPSDRGRKSIKNSKVYLDDGQEFEIELYNPLKECILCDIKLNGQSISKTGLILKPAQRFYLDCFIDDRKKFVFSTYEVDNNLESIDATSNNGKLEVFFYKESVVNIENWKNKFDKVIIKKYYPIYQNNYYDPWNNPVIYGNSIIGTNCTSGISNLNLTTSTSNLNIGTVTNTTSIETGRVEKGSSSSQKFESLDMDFDTNYISSTILQLIPNSRKPLETKDIKEVETKGNEIIELIKKLSDLHSAGILTNDEFTKKKSELLSKI